MCDEASEQETLTAGRIVASFFKQVFLLCFVFFLLFFNKQMGVGASKSGLFVNNRKIRDDVSERKEVRGGESRVPGVPLRTWGT